MATSWAGSLLMVTAIKAQLWGWKVLNIDHTLGGIWHVFTRSKHRWLPWKNGWSRQYKSDHLRCPHRIQDPCYSVAGYAISVKKERACLQRQYEMFKFPKTHSLDMALGPTE